MLSFEYLNTNLFKDVPFYICRKDLDHAYISANSHVIKTMGFKSENEIIGKKDSDLPWEEDAKELEEVDKYVLAGNSIINVKEPRWHPNGYHMLITNKMPIRNDNNKIDGILIMHHNISAEESQQLIEKNDATLKDSTKADASKIFLLINKIANITLTSRELACLSLWMCGHSIKESSYRLGLSHKTIECYRTNIKNKINVHHKFQLIKFMQTKGVLDLCISLARMV